MLVQYMTDAEITEAVNSLNFMYPQYAPSTDVEDSMNDNTSIESLILSDDPETVYNGSDDDHISDYSALYHMQKKNPPDTLQS